MHAPPRPHPGLAPVRVNLYSDTQTKPSTGMREAIAAAEVGDEQYGSDPTVTALCDRMAALLGKEAALFLPSGTMCNQIAILTHCRPGDEILAHEHAHIISSEGGAASALGGAFVTGLSGSRGMFDVATLEAAFRPKTRYAPRQVLVAVEQTSNLGGGAIWAFEQLNAIAAAAHGNDMVTHMDGARLMNAVVATGVSAREYAANYDSVWVDFTKGLGAPLGAVLAGSHSFIDAAWRWKQRVGGSLRQAGICAAACLYALDHNVERLAEDHANAKLLAQRLAEIPGLEVEPPESNLVFVDTSGIGLTAVELFHRLLGEGIMVSAMGRHRVRACTHLDVDRAGVLEAIEAVRRIVDRLI